MYVYPDMRSVYIGQFQNGEMINAKRSKITKERCHQGIKEIKIAKPKPYAPIVRLHVPIESDLAAIQGLSIHLSRTMSMLTQQAIWEKDYILEKILLREMSLHTIRDYF